MTEKKKKKPTQRVNEWVNGGGCECVNVWEMGAWGVWESVWVPSECVSEPRNMREAEMRGEKEERGKKTGERMAETQRSYRTRKCVEKEEFVEKARKKKPESERTLKGKRFSSFIWWWRGQVWSSPVSPCPWLSHGKLYLLWGTSRTSLTLNLLYQQKPFLSLCVKHHLGCPLQRL